MKIPSIRYTTEGIVHAIIPDANPMTHKIKIRAKFDKAGKSIFPDMYAKAIIPD